MTEYNLIRSKRRTAAIHIKDGGVEVRTPLKMPKRDIDKFIALQEKWITERLAQSRLSAEQRRAFSLNYGDTVTFRGVEYPLSAKDGSRAGYDGDRFYMPLGLTPEQVKPTVMQPVRVCLPCVTSYAVNHSVGTSPRQKICI